MKKNKPIKQPTIKLFTKGFKEKRAHITFEEKIDYITVFANGRWYKFILN